MPLQISALVNRYVYSQTCVTQALKGKPKMLDTGVSLTHLCLVDSSIQIFGHVHFLYRGVWQFYLLPCFVEISELYANNVDPDQMPHSVESDLGLHCLPMSLLWDARHKWVKTGS